MLCGTLLACACAAPGPPRSFHFESNRPPVDARGCALAVLDRNGFEVPELLPDSGVVLALRAPSPSAALDEREWWRVELAVGPGGRIPSVLEGSSGVSRSREGPWQAPGPLLEHVLGEVSARCTWGTAAPGVTTPGVPPGGARPPGPLPRPGGLPRPPGSQR